MSSSLYEEGLARLDALIGPIDDGSARARRRAHVLRVATELIAQQGYRKTSMDEVARRAGVAKGTVYTYYPTKVDLVVAAIALEKREHAGEMMAWLDPALSAEQRLRNVLLGVLLMPARMPLVSSLLRGDREMSTLMADLPPELQAEHADSRNDFLGGLIDEVARPHGWTRSEINDRAAIIAGLGFISPQLNDDSARGGVPLPRYAEILADMIIAGLKNARTKGDPP
ncbi:MAG: TetR/AcrR family transcriptional regulator [Deltaproteobacteria bacterium]|nr:TetR/AcrR family transcriptional regulator [Deltaproteobacteria bacterium]